MARRRPARRVATTAVRALDLDDATAATRADPASPAAAPLEDLAGTVLLDRRRARWREERARFEAHARAKPLAPPTAEPDEPPASP